MKNKILLGLSVFVMLFYLDKSAEAVLYQYAGNPFTEATAPFAGERITGSVEVVNPLAGQTAVIGSWVFSSGPISISSDMSNVWSIKSATISDDLTTFTYWSFYLSYFSGLFIETTYDGGHLPLHTATIDLVGNPRTLGRSGPDNAGVWRLADTTPAPVSEPSTILLLGFGLVSLARVVAKNR